MISIRTPEMGPRSTADIVAIIAKQNGREVGLLNALLQGKCMRRPTVRGPP